MPAKVREILEKRMGLVQDTVTLETLFDCFFPENGKVGCSQIVLKALLKFLTNRRPQRGQKRPHGK